MILGDILASIKDKTLVLFVGAGVSASPPSCLPLSNELKEGMIQSLLRSAGKIGQDYASQKAREISEKCRGAMLEKLLQIVHSTIDRRALEPLKVFEMGEPNDIHGFVVELLNESLVSAVFTTNFDQLLERASEDVGTRIRVCVRDKHFTISESPSIFKLHGSVEQKDTIAATLEKVESLPQEKARVLIQFLESSDFLFLGWSDDDLDVSPILLQNGAKRFFWIRHSRERDHVRVVHWSDISPDLKSGVDSLIRKHKGWKLEIHTEEFIKRLAAELNVSLPAKPASRAVRSRDRLPKVLGRWARRIGLGDRFLIIGDIVAYFGWPDDARLFYEKALETYQSKDDKPGLFIVNLHLGEFCESIGDFEGALSHYGSARTLCENSGGRLGMAIVLYKEAMLHERKTEFGEALSKYDRCLKISDSLGNTLWVANSLHQVGIIHEGMGNLEKAISLYSQSAQLRKRINDIEGWVASQSQLASAHAVRGDYEEAGSILEETADILRKIGNVKGAAILLHKQGHLYQLLGRYDESLDYLNRSLEIKKDIGFEEDIAETLHELAIVLHEKDELEEAMNTLQDVLDIRRKYQDRKGIGQALHEIGMIEEKKGDLSKALKTYEESLRCQREIGYQRGMSQTYHQIGIVLMKMGRFEDALKSLQNSIRIKREVGDREGEASSYHQIGMIYHENLRMLAGNADETTLDNLSREAISYYDRALRIRRTIGNQLGIAISLAQIGIFQYDVGQVEKAVIALEEAERIFSELKSPKQVLVADYLAKIDSETKRDDM